MKQYKQLLFTFDYELFLGKKSGTVEKCLIEPTNRVVETFNSYNFRAIFFVDTTYLLQLKKVSIQYPLAEQDFKKISMQLQQLTKQGHYIFPHLHPHWLDAQYLPEINQWKLENLSKYRLNNISVEERESLFSQSINILNGLIKPLNENYLSDGYRAGGWCIQPFEDFKSLFEKFNISYDFSVLREMKNFSQMYHYDFSNIPTKNIYRFSDDITKEDRNGKFTEFVISTITFSKFNNFLNRILLKYLWKTNNRTIGDGNSVDIPSDAKHNSEMISIELLTLARFRHYFHYFRKYDFMHFISHPKMLSKHNLNIFEKFLRRVNKEYRIETNFRNMI